MKWKLVSSSSGCAVGAGMKYCAVGAHRGRSERAVEDGRRCAAENGRRCAVENGMRCAMENGRRCAVEEGRW